MSGKWLQLRRKGGERKKVVYSYIWFWTRDSLDAEMSASVYSWQRTSRVILFLFDETTVRVGEFTDTPLNKNKNHGSSGNEIRAERSNVTEVKRTAAWWCALGSSTEGSRCHHLLDLTLSVNYVTSWRCQVFCYKLKMIMESLTWYYCEANCTNTAYIKQLALCPE